MLRQRQITCEQSGWRKCIKLLVGGMTAYTHVGAKERAREGVAGARAMARGRGDVGKVRGNVTGDSDQGGVAWRRGRRECARGTMMYGVRGVGWCMRGTKLLHRTELLNTVCTVSALLESNATCDAVPISMCNSSGSSTPSDRFTVVQRLTG